MRSFCLVFPFILLVCLALGMLAACGHALETRAQNQKTWGQGDSAGEAASRNGGQADAQIIDLAGELGGIGWLDEDDRINLQCLRQSYPSVVGLARDSASCLYLVMTNGQRPVYKRSANCKALVLEADIATSMAQPYPLDPMRPETPPGFAPGRQRSRELLTALYGEPGQVGKYLRNTLLLGRGISLAEAVAPVFAQVAKKLQALAQARPELGRWLKPDGGYSNRKIAGENRTSPHSYGIALDLSAHLAAYWRWSRQRPHPQQNSYPGEIVSAFEEAGFVWGGKWHEYDIMHFEYRPEIICKARLMTSRKTGQVQDSSAPAGGAAQQGDKI